MSNYTFINYQSLRCRATYIAKMVSLAAVLMIANFDLSAQCDFTMACNDGIQVSLDDTSPCDAVITPDMVAENIEGPDSDYTVTVMESDGTVVPNATVTFEHAGDTLTVSVEHNVCQLACWGTIVVEDKLPPVYDCAADPNNSVDVACNADLTPQGPGYNGTVPFPLAQDACSGITYTYTDVTSSLSCVGSYAYQVIRTWVATDIGGNSASCTQTINVERALLSDVIYPMDYVTTLNATDCYTTVDTLSNGAPTPAVSGEPTNTSCSNIVVNYSDFEFEICGNGKKFIRTWTVIDWCTGAFDKIGQTIKIEDVSAPVIVCDEDETILIMDESCTADYVAPFPDDDNIGTDNVISECSSWKYKVLYSISEKLPDGTCPTDFVGTFIEADFNNDGTIDSDGFTSDGTFTAPEIPEGCAWIRYVYRDACGFEEFCSREILVEDGVSPSPACEAFTVVSLDNTGWAKAFAESFDDGSWDNCMVDRFEVRRVDNYCDDEEDLVYGESVHFCCEDVMRNPIRVEMRVYDKAGNYNHCTVNVTVKDAIPPTLTCPTDRVITCIQDQNDLILTGAPSYSNLCGNSYSFSYTDAELFNSCGIGTITRTWTLDAGPDAGVVCTQLITVNNNDPLASNDISWPGNRTITGCSVDDAHPDLINSRPDTDRNNGCTDIAISYTDVIVPIHPSYCFQILRTWKVIDWCTYAPGSASIFEHVQTINVNNNQGPTFTSSCDDVTLDADPGSCDGYVELVATAINDCYGSALTYSWEIDAYDNGTVDFTGVNNNASGTYPAGTHEITFTATNACGTSNTCTYHFTINDNKPPTPICLSDVVWVLGSDGTTEVWASDFDFKSEDTCTPNDQLIFAFDQYGNNQVMYFDCSDIPNGIAASIPLDMYVIDSDGNFDFCSVVLNLQDSGSNNTCPDLVESMARLSGKVMTEDLVALQDIPVQLENIIESNMDMEMTNIDGEYAFDNVGFYNQYEIAPKKNDDPLNGVSTLDLVLIQKHILGIQSFDSPMQLIAADINGSAGVSAVDLIELRKLILGIYEEFPNNESWRFMPTTYEIEDPTSPWGFPEGVGLDSLYLSATDLDFYAIKTGDLNGSAQVGLQSDDNLNSRSVDDVKLLVRDMGEEVVVAFDNAYATDLLGMQFSLKMQGLELSKVEGDVLKLSNYHVAENHFNLSWNDTKSISTSDDEHMTIVFSKLDNDYSIAIDQDMILAEAYDTDLEVYSIVLESRALNAYELDQMTISPNPFAETATISFIKAENENIKLNIFDTNGKHAYQYNGALSVGTNEVIINQSDLPSAGVYYVQLEKDNTTTVQKLIVIR